MLTTVIYENDLIQNQIPPWGSFQVIFLRMKRKLL
jgi:hypothetical protein